MPRIALLIEYSGTNLHGSQYQVGVRTVQHDLENALSSYLREPAKVLFAGRTDTGVHAAGQVVHFEVDDLEKLPSATEYGGIKEEAEPTTERLQNNLWRLVWGLNGILKDDISVARAQVVPDDFHARFSAVERTYVYRILNRPQRSALLKNTHYFVPFPLELDRMRAAADMLRGSHDFSAFRSTNSDRGTSQCQVSRSELLNLGEGQLEFWIAANHFVYNMVRIIVGTLIEIGLGKRSPEMMSAALSSGKRDLAGTTAPPWGLTLVSVKYPEAYRLFEEKSREYILPDS